MITRKKAEEAAAVLGYAVHDGPFGALRVAGSGNQPIVPMENSEAAVTAAYKARAKEVHPDMPGGSAEAFARVDWAKHVLLAWLKQAAPAERSVFGVRRCEVCNGTGKATVQRGFNQMKIICGACKGSGDADYDACKVDHGR